MSSGNYDLTALTGLNAAAQRLNVISDNIANSQTVGFKARRSEFADMYTQSIRGHGSGVRQQLETQSWSQGVISTTNNDLDMAMNGEGFFILEDTTNLYDTVYTRNGSFKLDKDGFITAQNGYRVQGYLKDENASTQDNTVFRPTLDSLNISELNADPRQTQQVEVDINLNSSMTDNADTSGNYLVEQGSGVRDAATGLITTFPTIAEVKHSLNGATGGAGYFPFTSGSPDFSTTKVVYDSLGGEHRLQMDIYKLGTTDNGGNLETEYHVHYTMNDYDQATGTWQPSAMTALDGATAGTAVPASIDHRVRFDESGQLVGMDTGAGFGTVYDQALTFNLNNPTPAAGQALAFNVDVNALTQYAGANNIRGISQDGFAVGEFVGMQISSDGIITARYSNGRSDEIAQVAVANFEDKSELDMLGGQMYAQTFDSGEVQIGIPEASGFGSLEAGSLELSNVDTTKQLVDMITAQRTYQASAQVISTSQQLTQTILQL